MTTKQTPPTAVRNTPALIKVLGRALPPDGKVLEIASGSGYHIHAFAQAFPNLQWQPSDPNDAARASITNYVEDAATPNLGAPIALDVLDPQWFTAHLEPKISAIVCINMIHISPWAATLGLFNGAGHLLDQGQLLFTYGPYIIRGDFIAESNLAFDQSLKARNPDWGLREVDNVTMAARRAGFQLENMVPMPANNFSLVFRKDA